MSTLTDPEVAGIGLPFRFEQGRIVTERGSAKLRSNLAHIMLCAKGERTMARDYGAGLRQLVHDPNNDALRAIVQHELRKAITRWEPRVRATRVEVSQADGVLWIQLEYVVLQTREQGSVSLPFGMSSP